MNHLIRAGAITVAIFSSVGFAAAQNPSGGTSGSARPDLTSRQEQMVSQGLAKTPSQSAPAGMQPQIGNQVPDSMSAQALPSNVTDQVPETKNLLFIKLPDRILLIDPDTKIVAEMIMDDTTTGSAGSNPGSSNPSSSPSR